MNRKIVHGNFRDGLIYMPDGQHFAVNGNVTKFLRGFQTTYDTLYQGFRFARRPFVGATRLVFKFKPACAEEECTIDNDNFELNGFISYPTNSKFVWLCAKHVRPILGVGNRTKSFSLWVDVD